MRRWAALALALGTWLAAGGAAAQPGMDAGPVPAGDATLRGRVVHTDGSPAEGLDVVLYAVRPGGPPGLARSVTAADGSFAFADVSNDPAVAYLVGVRAGDVPYGERVSFAPGERETSLEIEVADTDAATHLVRHGPVTVRIDPGCAGFHVSESHELSNPTDRVVYVPEAEREGREPILAVRLPAGAGNLTGSLGMPPPGLVRSGDEVRFWGPVYPGSQELEFAYGLAAPEEGASTTWGYPAGEADLTLLARGAGFAAPALAAADERVVGDQRYEARHGSVAPGGELEATLPARAETSTPLRLEEVQISIELDDAALLADEQYRLSVPGDAPLGPTLGTPLFCVDLPAESDDLRFSQELIALGPTADPSGGLALRGPIPAGETVFSVGYRLPVVGARTDFTRRFSAELPLLEVYVADTGVRPVTERLHRRKPIRTQDRNYLQLEGFGIQPGEEVHIDFERLDARRPLPELAAVGFGLLAAGATFAFLLGPLRRGDEEQRAPTRADELAAEREAVYGVIHDLDEDFETGKLSEEDHAAMRGEMRARAVHLLQQERAAAAQAASGDTTAAPAPGDCPRCGADLPDQARFCPRCGERLGSGDA